MKGDSNLSCSVEELKEAIDKLKVRKTCSYDKLSSIFFKALKPSISKIIKELLNSFTRVNFIPKCLKTSLFIVIPKICFPSSNPSKYKPISLISILSKIVEYIILNRLKNEIKKRNILFNAQNSIRKGCSSILTLWKVVNDFSDSLKQNKVTLVTSIDFNKAFDNIWHMGLLYKLTQYQISIPMIH